MAAAVAAPSGAALRSPEEHLNALGQEMADICKKLVARIAYLERENAKVHAQLDDAIDRVHELESELGTARGQIERALGARSTT